MGHFKAWDSKITTFPGVYYISAIAHGFVGAIVSGGSQIFDDSTQCSGWFLRGVNLALGWACVFVIHGIVSHQSQDGQSFALFLRTVLCATFPLHAFFVHLYYTDTASTLFVLSTWLALLKHKYGLSGILSACCILMRQTNAVWIVYLVAWEVCHMATLRYGEPSSLGNHVAVMIRFILDEFISCIAMFWIHILSVASFALFVLYNGGIVLGDKEHHVPVAHWAQPFYFYTFLVVSTAPIWLNGRYRVPGLVPVMVLLGLAFLAVQEGTLVHPFILADNRHYTFYLWRKVLGASAYSRYLMVPLYAMAVWLSIFAVPCRSSLQNILLAGSTCMVLIPAHLVEFRYFTIPWYLYMLNEHSVLFQTGNTKRTALTIVGYFVVNAITMYVFLYKTFTWPDGSVARFMW
jgi:alpha-1,2-glucosyltransferase